MIINNAITYFYVYIRYCKEVMQYVTDCMHEQYWLCTAIVAVLDHYFFLLTNPAVWLDQYFGLLADHVLLAIKFTSP